MGDLYERINSRLTQDYGPGQLTPIKYRLATHSTLLNCATGGGIPAGRVVEILGENQVGKSATLLKLSSIVQQLGGYVWYADTEGKLDYDLAQKLGVDTQQPSFRVDTPVSIEHFQDAFIDNLKDIAAIEAKYIRETKQAPPPTMTILDSIAMLGAQKQSEKDVLKSKLQPMSLAQMWTNFFLRKEVKALKHLNHYFLIVNQFRDNVDFMGYGKAPVKSPGGKMVKYAAALRLHLTQTSLKSDELLHKTFTTKESEPGYLLDYYVDKNSAGAPWRKASIPFFFHRGFDDPLGCFVYLRSVGVLAFSGGYKIGSDLVGKSFAEALARLQDPAFVQWLQHLTAQVYLDNNTYSDADWQR